MYQPHKLIAPPHIVFTRTSAPDSPKGHLTHFHEAKLKRRLARALEIENYEAAILYRDELRGRSTQ